ncbi:O-antigen polymerase [Candidatus Pelagibacter sp.]|uniref:O-antigen polymerase n=1 Tax=Candidatus Pelagibacter sp. TaxID=2024849 RepID=UPI003F847DC7
MSHLFKNDKKKFFKLSKLFFFLLIIIFIYLGFQSYTGNKLLYLSFSIIFNYLLIFAVRKNSMFFETFLSIFLWLGFWFKFTFIITFSDGNFAGDGNGSFDYSYESFNEVLIISQVGVSAFIIGGFLREYFLFSYPKKIDLQIIKKNFFILGRKYIWIIFTVFFLLIALLNFHFKIYQRGLLPIYDLNFLISGIFKWLLLFGLSAFGASLIFYEYIFFKKFFLISILIIFLETFFTSLSMLSRGMIFNAFALLLGIYKFSNKVNSPNSLSYYLKLISLIVILFYVSVSVVNYARANYFYVGKSFTITNNNLQNKTNDIKKYSTSKQINSEILYLMVNRWVGIDALMAVVGKKEKLGFSFLKSALNEKASTEFPTFYEINFDLRENMISDTKYQNVKGNTLPGIIAFTYYSGSYYFLFILILLITILSSVLEFLAFKLSSKNLIFSALIGQVIAFRFIHFGYLPSQTYLLFFSIFITIIFVYIITTYLKKEHFF